ncbi:hypothetical protein ASE14_06430 [Agromyces sp. Root81]|uniref:hypothetical protein n=1 Tax=Agromyces sp. Root81 TaxID=1736601 RepID=UPI0007007C36|nr:hypothetical protein [Agromyces sp. Root81]KRC60623.1 hypothetical protein ASE14_06430 [Agromyces sp. Root81]
MILSPPALVGKNLPKAYIRHNLARLAEIDDEIDALRSRRTEAVQRLIEELEWMDCPTLKLRGYDGSGLARTATGIDVHVVRQLEEHNGYVQHRFHLADDCPGVWCDRLGKVRRTHHHRGSGYQFTYLGFWHVVARQDDDVILIPVGEAEPGPTIADGD